MYLIQAGTNIDKPQLTNSVSINKSDDILTEDRVVEHRNNKISPIVDRSKDGVYKIKLKTNKKEFTGKGTGIQLELIGENGQSKAITLDRSEMNSIPFEN